MSLKLNTKYLKDFVNADELAGIKAQVEAAAKSLQEKSGLGNDFLGWVDLPTAYDKEEFARIKAAAERIKANSDILIVIGIELLGYSVYQTSQGIHSYHLHLLHCHT